MGMKKVALDAGPMDVGSLHNVKGVQSGHTLDSADVIAKLAKACPGIHADWGGRLGLWHPRIEERQGLFYYHKHICGMDRGVLRQWPEWSACEEMVEVDMAYAITHDDMPVCMGACDEDSPLPDTALVYRSKPDRCLHLGWAELFFQLTKRNLPNIDRRFLERTFKVNLAFLDQMKCSPVSLSYQKLDQRMPGERAVDISHGKLPNASN